MNTPTQALIEAGSTFAWTMRDDNFTIVGVEVNHQDDQAWDVLISYNGTIERVVTWKEDGDWFAEW